MRQPVSRPTTISIDSATGFDVSLRFGSDRAVKEEINDCGSHQDGATPVVAPDDGVLARYDALSFNTTSRAV